MKTILTILLLLLTATAVLAEDVDLDAMSALAARYPLSLEIGTQGTDSYRFIYTNSQARLYVFIVEDGELRKDWETTDLGSKAVSVVVTDLNGDGVDKLIVATVRGRVLIYDMESYNLEWENLQLRYASIDYLTCANLDNDPQQEVVIIADNLLGIFDGLNKNIQWISDTKFAAKMMLIADVDDDPQLEIILNTGRVVDSRFYNIEFESDGPFGDRIQLFDVNGDGYLDVFGEFADFSIRVYDIWSQREMW